MKKYLFFCLAVLALLVSCEKEPADPAGSTITYELIASYPGDSKAVKTGWEDGDVIYVFFDKVAAPKYLKMSYNNGTWSYTEPNGELGLRNNDPGKMRAVFLPFGNDATVAAGENGRFVFSKTLYTYYLTGTLEYEVVNNTLSGSFRMDIPDGYVQLFVEDANAADGKYELGTDAVIPTAVASVTANGEIVEENRPDPDSSWHYPTSLPSYAIDLPGYAYGTGNAKGYLFSGKLNGDYLSEYGKNYYFALTFYGISPPSRKDYFVQRTADQAPLSSLKGIKLPAINSASWQPVGAAIAINLGTSVGTWNTCNDDTRDIHFPEYTKAYTYSQAGSDLPSKKQFDDLMDNCTWTWMSIHGTTGVVFKPTTGTGFLFLPTAANHKGFYWTSVFSGNEAQCFYISKEKVGFDVSTTPSSEAAFVRRLSSN